MLNPHRRVLVALTLAVAAGGTVRAQNPTAPVSNAVRSVPPPGIAIPESDRTELTEGVAALGKEIDALRTDLKARPELLRYLPDVVIYYNAVRFPLNYNEFFNIREVGTARNLLTQGRERAKALREGKAPWATQAGLVALGYVSKIDGSVQPYGMVIPPMWGGAGDAKPRRLDIFCHGRGDTMTELSFINTRQRSPGEFTPPDTFVLHPYGRFCNATRFAGEVDVEEAMADAKRRYPIDDDRVVMMGFSMGGASAWMLATHHADEWCAASPGAGFAETAIYTKAFAPGKTPPPWYEQKLWNLYDSTAYAVNLAQCPTVAYSGGIDPQKQSADLMEEALKKEGLPLIRVIGPNTGHKYHPDSKVEISRRLGEFTAKGRDRNPRQIRFTTFTLRYNHMDWVSIQGLGKHWERARVEAERSESGDTVTLKTENVTELNLDRKRLRHIPRVTIDGQNVGVGAHFVKNRGGKWTVVTDQARPALALRKRPGLQGPIDDAFMDRFVMVRPTGKPMSDATGAWVQEEMAHAASEWRTMFRAEAPMVDDTAVTPAQISRGNLVLWGDPSSNAILAKIADRLPVRWDKDGAVRVGAKTYTAGTHVPVLIFPNPLSPAHYVVINSGLTWREAHEQTNSQQTPKLPDWAVIDITTPPDRRAPGRVEAAGFFDENWRLDPKSGEAG